MSYNNTSTGGMNPLSNDPTQGGQYNSNISSNNGPHSSSIGNTLDPRFNESEQPRTAAHTTTGTTGTAGPHSSNLANKLDPRVDSTTGHSTSTASSGANLGPQHSTEQPRMAAHTTTGTAGTAGPHSSNLANKLDPRVDSTTGHSTTTASSGTNLGPHDSSIANKLDPRVDSDTGRSNLGGSTAQQHGTTAAYGGVGTSAGHTSGPHDSNVANKLDPRVDSDNSGRSHLGGRTTHPTTGAYGTSGTTTGHTAGPHDSKVANKVDPRVDSDTGRTTHPIGGTSHGNRPHDSSVGNNRLDPTVGGTTGTHQTTGTTTGTHTAPHGVTGGVAGTTDSSQKSGGATGALKSVAAGIHGMGEKIRGATGAVIDKATSDADGLRKNEAIKRQGEQEMRTGQFSKDTKSREGLHHTPGGATFLFGDAMAAAATIENTKHQHGLDAVSEESLSEDGLTMELLEGASDPIYEAKARLINKAMQDIGMGWYQWQLFVVIGFGWASDNLWPIVTSLIFTPVKNEFQPSRTPYLTLSQNIGLLVGAVFWGFGCDIYGRRWAFNLTIGITSIFGLVAAGAPNFAAIATFAALWSIGVGGNLPVDSAIFLEFLPGSHQYLLTILSIDWAFAQVIANLVAWPLLGKLTCQENDNCTRAANMGWRYFLIAMGGMSMVMFFLRFACFTMFESPKYLMGRGQDNEAVRVVHEVARRNGTTSWLTVDHLKSLGPLRGTGTSNAINRKLEKINLDHVKGLFATRRLAFSTTLIIIVWAFIGLGFPLYNAFLPYIQATRGVDFGDSSTYITYRNSLIIAVLGVPGCLVGGVLVEVPRFGRKGALSVSTMLTGVFLFASTTATSSNSLLGWNCAYNFMSNIMYAVLYAYTPEIFPTKDRGTGNALTAAANRIFGIMAPIIAMFANLETAVPVYVSGTLFIAAGCLVVLQPFESRGKASL
ncbi:hypothetical protein LOZ61_001082 [Ophidiomyces ophidiicola]|nr:hypothetical protein LOZ64_005409 [Ophidiomyces ophidiicola]KAI1916426.1 hypothetical protein LOZ61_001082 [Ophidiomyces ophidiicola]KAI1960114.1 hypothetical protein LOZ59_002769 [Ophidiomyces ophidiicola]KAI2265231.1 hypothetical protein LOZ05_004820 [Ophidiomyces ophidiicola]KAI2291806.1 hypothetical protein LOZ03_003166 [Ophidiomyces ophidiicola]